MNHSTARLDFCRLSGFAVAACLLWNAGISSANAQYFRGGPLRGSRIPRVYMPIPVPFAGPVFRPAYQPSIPPVPRLRSSAIYVTPGATLQRRSYSSYSYPPAAYGIGYGVTPYPSFSLRIETAPVYGGYSYSTAAPQPSYRPSIAAERSLYDGTIQVTPDAGDQFGPGNFGPEMNDANGSLSPIPNTANAGDIADRLHRAATRLQQSLSVRGDDGEVWLEYLAPQAIIAKLNRGQESDFAAVLKNYDGVAANRDLGAITRANGFAETRQLLRQMAHTDSSTGSSNDELGESAVDSEASELPAPVPDPLTSQAGPTLAAPIAPAESDGTK